MGDTVGEGVTLAVGVGDTVGLAVFAIVGLKASVGGFCRAADRSAKA